MADVKGSLTSLYNGFSKVATVSGLLLLPFFGVSAYAYLAAHGAASTVGGVLTSFWNPLFTNAAGTLDVAAGVSKVFNGWAALGKSAYALGSSAVAGVQSGAPFLQSIQTALATPVPALS